VKLDSATAFLLTAAATALTWPMALAYGALRFAFARPYVANEASTIAIAISTGVALIAVAIFRRRPPADPVSWVIIGALFGAILGDIWLALGAYVQSNRTIGAFGWTLLGGFLYAAPIGLIIGMILGAEVMALQRWNSRRAGPQNSWMRQVMFVAVNAVVAGVLCHGAEGIRGPRKSANFVPMPQVSRAQQDR
jgi:hypothetical protein